MVTTTTLTGMDMGLGADCAMTRQQEARRAPAKRARAKWGKIRRVMAAMVNAIVGWIKINARENTRDEKILAGSGDDGSLYGSRSAADGNA